MALLKPLTGNTGSAITHFSTGSGNIIRESGQEVLLASTFTRRFPKIFPFLKKF